MLLLALTAFGAGQTNAQTVNKDRYITLTVESGVNILLELYAAADATPILIESGSKTYNETVNASWSGLKTYLTDGTTMTVYGDLWGYDFHDNGVNVTGLDASHNTDMGALFCDGNRLTSLDLSANINLQYLFCSNNQLTELGVSKNTYLEQMDCSNNQLTELDVTANTNLQLLACDNNHLTSLDLTANTSLTDFYCAGNKAIVNFPVNLTDLPGSFNVDNASEWNGGSRSGNTLSLESGAVQVTYTYDCGNDHTAQFALVQNSTEELDINATNFPDEIFRNYVSVNFDKSGNGKLSLEERVDVTSLDVVKTEDTPDDQKIADLTGIEHFQWLTFLNCGYNKLTALDVSKNTALQSLYCYENQITSLDVTHNTQVGAFGCSRNKLTTLDVSRNTKLYWFNCAGNLLSELNVSNNTTLQTLYCDKNQLTELDVSYNTALQTLDCSNNHLTSLDVSANTALTNFSSDGNKAVVNFPVTLTDLPGSFNVDNASEWNGGTPSDGKVSLEPGAIQVTYTYNCGNGKSAQFALVQNSTEELEINEINFPDAIFRQYVKDNFDKNNNDSLSIDERVDVTSLDVVKTEDTPDDQKIADLTGIEHFQWLTFLNCGYNKLTALDVSKNTALQSLYCYENQITTLDVSQNTKLYWFNCAGNQLTELDLSANTALQTLYCYNNQFTSLDVSANTALQLLSCFNNQLTSLDVNANTALQKLYCYDNQLTSLDLSANTALWVLNCSNNFLTSLDVSNTALTNNLWADGNSFAVGINPLDVTTLPGAFEIKRASNWTNASASGNILTINDSPVTYQYDCGKDKVVTFTLTTDQLDCTLTFDANGGTGTISNTLEGNKVQMRKNTVYTLPECTFTAPVNMQFDQWDCGNPGDAITVDKDVTVKALWKHIPATITFNSGEGSGTMASVTVNKGSQYTLPGCSFTAPEGKVFSYWQIGSGSTTGKPGDQITVVGNMTLTAIWVNVDPEKATITFDAGEGSGTMASVQVAKNSTYKLPGCAFTAPTGKEFAHWDKGEVGAEINVTGNITLTAQWKWIHYTVSFMPNSGSGTMANQEFVYNTAQALNANIFTRTNFKFTGWNTSANGSGTPYADKATVNNLTTEANGVVTLYAQWEAQVTITFDANGGTGTMAPVTVDKGSEYTLPSCTFTAPTGKEFYQWDKGAVGEKITVNENVTLKALWKENTTETVTITFDANGGTGSMAPVKVEKGSEYVLPACGFTAPAGKEFDQWDQGATGTKIPVNEDLTLKALWKDKAPEMVTITFKANGGTGTMDPVTVEKGSEYTLPECGFTAPEGKVFDQWKVNNKKYNPGETVTADKNLTVTALWKKVTAVDVDRSAQLTLYPNPASNVLYINGVDLKTISLYDMLGRLVIVRPADSATATAIDVNTCQTGVYLVRIELTNGQIITRKAFINK